MVIAITGMHRSGTSCITGLLARCGFGMGTSHPILNDARFDNPKGHHENLGALAINEAILKRAGGSWCALPQPQAVLAAGEQVSPHIAEFARTFDGDICKDPRTCLTIASWEKHCPGLRAVVFCLRNPIGVAASLKRRNGFPLELGLQLWYQYNARFYQGVSRVPVVAVDYDGLGGELEPILELTVAELGLPLSRDEIRERIAGFYSPGLNHDPSNESHLSMLPPAVRKLYRLLRAQCITRASRERSTTPQLN